MIKRFNPIERASLIMSIWTDFPIYDHAQPWLLAL